MQSNEIFGGDTLDFHFQKNILQNYKKKYISGIYKNKTFQNHLLQKFRYFAFFRYFRNSKFKKKSTHTHFFFWKLFLCVDMCK